MEKIQIRLSVNTEKNGIEVIRPDRKLTEGEFKALSKLADYGLVYFKKYSKYLNQAYRVDVKSILSDKNFEVIKSETFDADYKKVMSYWKKNTPEKKSTPVPKKSAPKTPDVAPQNSSDEIDKINNRLDNLDKTVNQIMESLAVIVASIQKK